MDAAKIYPIYPELPPDRSAEDLIADYLDHLCAPLVGIVPFEERERLRREVEDNLTSCQELYVSEGYGDVDAAIKAIDKYGQSDEMAETYLEEYYRHVQKGWLAQKLGIPGAYAAIIFGQATLWGEIFVQYRVYQPNPQPYTFGLTIKEIRQVIPEPFPLPDTSPAWVLFWTYAFLAPIIAGWLVGRMVPSGAGKAVCNTQIALCLFTFIVGTFMLPTVEGLWLAIIEVFWWVPVGTLIAHVASVLYRRKRFRFQPHIRRKSS